MFFSIDKTINPIIIIIIYYVQVANINYDKK